MLGNLSSRFSSFLACWAVSELGTQTKKAEAEAGWVEIGTGPGTEVARGSSWWSFFSGDGFVMAGVMASESLVCWLVGWLAG